VEASSRTCVHYLRSHVNHGHRHDINRQQQNTAACQSNLKVVSSSIVSISERRGAFTFEQPAVRVDAGGCSATPCRATSCRPPHAYPLSPTSSRHCTPVCVSAPASSVAVAVLPVASSAPWSALHQAALALHEQAHSAAAAGPTLTESNVSPFRCFSVNSLSAG
jgi:hypothetical protein